MSNAKLRAKLQTLSAPVVAWMIDNGWVVDDGVCLEFTWRGYNEPGRAILEATRAIVQQTQQVMVPDMRRPRERL